MPDMHNYRTTATPKAVSPVADFHKRLQNEQAELGVKTEKLENFISGENIKTLPIEAQVLVHVQLHTMRQYLSILKKRLTLLEAGK